MGINASVDFIKTPFSDYFSSPEAAFDSIIWMLDNITPEEKLRIEKISISIAAVDGINISKPTVGCQKTRPGITLKLTNPLEAVNNQSIILRGVKVKFPSRMRYQALINQALSTERPPALANIAFNASSPGQTIPNFNLHALAVK